VNEGKAKSEEPILKRELLEAREKKQRMSNARLKIYMAKNRFLLHEEEKQGMRWT